MSEDLEYIERYFLGNLSAGEKEIFEKRCEGDPDFAREVSLYVTMRAGLKQTLIVPLRLRMKATIVMSLKVINSCWQIQMVYHITNL